jgi:flagellar basal body rod protein FlgB
MPGIQQFDTTMKLLQKVLDLRSKNQEIISSNIANAETPGYAAQSFTFEEQLKGALSDNNLHPVTTRPNHFPLAPSSLEAGDWFRYRPRRRNRHRRPKYRQRRPGNDQTLEKPDSLRGDGDHAQ